MTTQKRQPTKAQLLKKELNKVFPELSFSCTMDGSSIEIVVKGLIGSPYTMTQVEKVANQYRQVSYCEYSGEILAGGNTFVNVDSYDVHWKNPERKQNEDEIINMVGGRERYESFDYRVYCECHKEFNSILRNEAFNNFESWGGVDAYLEKMQTKKEDITTAELKENAVKSEKKPSKIESIINHLESNLPTIPYCSITVYKGLGASSIQIRGSFQSQKEWINNIWHNSPYFNLEITGTQNGSLTCQLVLKSHKISVKFRKYTGTLEQVTAKLSKWMIDSQNELFNPSKPQTVSVIPTVQLEITDFQNNGIETQEEVKEAIAERAKEYQEKIEAKKERWAELSDKWEKKAENRTGQASEISSSIPFGQPILVGHHSEKRHRRDLKRIHDNWQKSYEASQKAQYYAEKDVTTAVLSDDPEAIQKLKDKLQSLEESHAYMKAINTLWRKCGSPHPKQGQSFNESNWDAFKQAMIQSGIPQSWVNTTVKNLTGDFLERSPYSYHLPNNNAEIKRLKGRIEELRQKLEKAYDGNQETDYGDFIFITNYDENRYQFRFDGTPPEETRSILKSHGFRWSPRHGVWQCHLSDNGKRKSQEIIRSLTM